MNPSLMKGYAPMSPFPPQSGYMGPARLTPQNLARPLPDITQVLAPQQPVCSTWDNLNSWINQNPGIAVVGLAGVFLLIWSQR